MPEKLCQDSLSGRLLGHYRIVERIGAGGMGVVYRAHDERLDRDVAIKIMSEASLADDVSRRRFHREALALSKLNHTNIAIIHDFDTQDGIDFLVQELIEGLSLEEIVAKGPLPEKKIVNLGTQLCEGLDAAHERGIIHRDLKPSNIRITPEGRLKILDFGLAKDIEMAAALSTATQAQAVVGTLPYLSPEQLRNEKLDVRTDIWAVGCVLYEMATGTMAFSGRGLQVVDQILHHLPAKPSSLNPQLSAGLNATILKCLAGNADARYQSAKELGSALRQPVREVAIPALSRTEPSGTSPRTSIRSIAILPLANLSGDPQQEYFADGMTESLITDLGRLTGLKAVIARGSVMHYKSTHQPLSEIARELKVDALITGAVLRSGNCVRVTAQLVEPQSGEQLWTEHYEYHMNDVLQLQNEVTRTIAGEIRVKLTANEQLRLLSARSVNPRAYEANLMGRFHAYKMSRDGLGKALEYFQLAIDEDPSYAPSYASMGFAWQLMAHNGLVPSREGYSKVKVVVEKALELDSALVEGHDTLACYLFAYEWDWAGAEREFLVTIALNPNYANARCFYSLFLYAMRRFDEAKAQIERASELDPFNAFFHTARAVQLVHHNRIEDALALLHKAATLQPDSHYVHFLLWRALERKREYDKAFEEVKECYKLLGALEVVDAMEEVYRHDGGYQRALLRGADALAERSRTSTVRPTDVAELYLKGGDKESALIWLERAYEEHASMLIYLNVYPGFDPLRSDPQFQDLVRRMKFPEQTT